MSRAYSETSENRVASTSNRYVGLDAMRGLAALMVVAYHIDHRYGWSAHLAVDFFFVLSGFVITRAYQGKLESTLNFTGFVKTRLKRLYPLYIVGIAFGVLQIAILVYLGLDETGMGDLVLSAASNLLFLPSPSYFIFENARQGLFPTNGPAWSMFWEILINLIYAAFLFRLSLRSLIAILIASFVALVLSVVQYGNLNIGWEWPSAVGGLPRVSFSFTLGIIMGRTLSGDQPRKRTWLLLIPMAILTFSLFLPVQGSRQSVYELLFVAVISPAIVLAGIRYEIPDRLIPLAAFIGYASYPVYILHRGPLGLYKHLYQWLGVSAPVAALLFLIAITLFSVAVSRLTDHLIKQSHLWRRPKVEPTPI